MKRYALRLKVRDYEVDSEGIVNNANYLHYLEHTRHEMCAEAGISFGRMRSLGWCPVVNRVEIDYRRPLVSDSEFTSFIELRRKGPRFLFHQWIENARGEQVVDAIVSIVNTIHGRLTRGDEMAEYFPDYLA